MNGNSTLVHQANFSGGGFAKLLPLFFCVFCCCYFCFVFGPAYLSYFFFFFFFWGGGGGGVVTVGIFF